MHRRPSCIRALALLAAAACSGEGSGVDKAGGTRTKPPVVLTLADHEQGLDQVQAWIEEVQRRAGGSLRIQVRPRGLEPRLGVCAAKPSSQTSTATRLARRWTRISTLINDRLRLLHYAMNWQTHRTARLRGHNPHFMA